MSPWSIGPKEIMIALPLHKMRISRRAATADATESPVQWGQGSSPTSTRDLRLQWPPKHPSNEAQATHKQRGKCPP